jgi:Tol biopolymer transport system component
VIADSPAQPTFDVGQSNQVFVAKRHGGANRVTGRPGEHYFDGWAPDGKRIAVSTYRGIEIRSLGGRVLRVIPGGGLAAWAPDGRRIAFVGAGPHGRSSRLVVLDLRSGARQVMGPDVSGRPSWSPDGRTLFYVRTRNVGDPWGRTGLFAVPARGGTPRRLAHYAESCTDVAASPTGEWVMFGRGADLWIIRPDGSGERRLIRGVDCPGPPFYVPIPSYGWTFGGRGVYAEKSGETHPRIRMLSGRHRKLSVSFTGAPYAVSLDARRVAWVAGWYSRTLRSARSNGDDRRSLARFQSEQDPAADIDALVWSPGGRRLAIEAHGRQYPARQRR